MFVRPAKFTSADGGLSSVSRRRRVLWTAEKKPD